MMNLGQAIEGSATMRHARTKRVLLAVVGLFTAAVLILGLAGCREDAADLETVLASLPDPPRRVVLVGLDGADWNVIHPLMEKGQLPVLASLVEQGASGPLKSMEPMISPALWTTVVTGVSPERHGIRDFVFKEHGNDAQPIVNSTIRERLALWNILSGLGISVGMLDWYATWPAEPVNGFIISDRLRTMGPEADGVTYPSAEVLGDAIRFDGDLPAGRFPALDRLVAGFDTLPKDLHKALQEDIYRLTLSRNLYREHRPDFFAFYFKGLDAVGHFFWKYHDPDAEVYGEVDEREVDALGSIISDYYRLCDELLGAFLEEVADDTTVLIVSDHGFRAFGRPDNLIFDVDRLFSIMGLLEFENPEDAGRRTERKIRRAGTQAYTHEGTKIVSSFGERDRAVYLNVEGRDPEGVIDGERWREVRDEIRDRLASLKTDLGTRVFSRITVNDAPAEGSSSQEPDLYLRCDREIAFDYDLIVDGKSYPLWENFLWEYGNISGSHRDEGIFIARGPSIRGGAEAGSPRLVDIAPTILHLIGAPVPEDFEGEVLRGILTGKMPENRPRVASYEDLMERSDPSIATDTLDEEYRDKLRALGYVQ